MSTEYGASRSVARRSDVMQKTSRNDISSNDDDEDPTGSANNSIIGKVKSRVSSIIPSSFSKWFSPSTTRDDSLNGSLNVAGTTRRRRRLEIEDDEDDNGENYGAEVNKAKCGADPENTTMNCDENDSDKDSEDDQKNDIGVSTRRAQYTVKAYDSIRQPPYKRSRISFDVTDIHTPLIASTPAIGHTNRNINHKQSLEGKISKSSTSTTSRLYSETSKYDQIDVEQPPSHAFPTIVSSDIKSQEKIGDRPNNKEKLFDKISSRRTLHLPSTSQFAKEQPFGVNRLKRQSLSGVRDIKSQNFEIPSMCETTTNILESQTYSNEEGTQISHDKQSDTISRSNLNGIPLSTQGNKKPRLNGSEEEAEENNIDCDSASESNESCIANNTELPNNVSLKQRKTGLFNMSTLNSQSGKNSRTSSFGNGINFYSHLEGRKSLFSGGGAHARDSTNTLNNSTLSLTSLNRRQFNASIYGSTSALSDSRLLNTFSPFYTGKTTYGGAAAYKKYNSVVGAASKVCNLTPTIIRPTSSLSTLSSSNNSLVTANAVGNLGSSGGTENISNISTTAKRILDLINDFATPLSEAKKMANTNIKANPYIPPQAKSRLNESDIQMSRAIRLSQVRTPYTRPAVTLLPTKIHTTGNAKLPPPVRELQVPSMSQLLQMKKMQNTTERSRQIARENSINTTHSILGSVGGEYMQRVAIQNSASDKVLSEGQAQHQLQQQHTNKIKSKTRTSARITASKNAPNYENEELPPINLPNIAFPLMQSVPKFDIDLPKPPKSLATTVAVKSGNNQVDGLNKAKSAAEVHAAIESNIGQNKNNSPSSIKSVNTFGIGANYDSKHTTNTNSDDSDKTNAELTETKFNFKFSAPIAIAGVDASANSLSQKTAPTTFNNYKFSPPAAVCSVVSENSEYRAKEKSSSVFQAPPQLKSGSVLDALKKPFALPPAATKGDATSERAAVTQLKSGFGDQFKKSASNKWECGTCLILNENNSDKCVACESPRPASNPVTPASAAPLTSNAATSTFGAQFKKSTDQWECDVCMIRNKEAVDKCVACETPRKGTTTASKANTAASSLAGSSSLKLNSFGEQFKPNANTWECPTCLINNKNDCSECVACQTKNPNGNFVGSDNNAANSAAANNKVTTFKFGFSAATTTQSAASAPADNGFKSLAAAQLSEKWECEACMTRNDAARSKCVCCEQAKPGAVTPDDFPSNGPKFAFGTTASNKFTFGFGAKANAAATNIAPTSVAISNQKTDGANSKGGLAFGQASTVASTLPAGGSSGSGGFTFGTNQPSQTATAEKASTKETADNKDQTDKGPVSSTTSFSGFKFGTSASVANNDMASSNNTTTSGFKFGVPSITGSAQPTATTPAAAPPKSDAKSTPPSNKAAVGGFSFGGSTAKPPTTSEFSFDASEKPSDAGEASNIAAGKQATPTTTAAPFSFGSTSSNPAGTLAGKTSAAAATSTAAIKPMFSFGNTAAASSTTKSTSSASASIITATATKASSAFSNPSGGFSFGTTPSSSASDTVAPVAKSLFGSFVAPSASAPTSPSAATSAPTTMPPPQTSAAPTANIFGTFGGENVSAAKTTTTTSSSSATATPTTNTNIFGVRQIASGGDAKPIASATMIFGSGNNAAAVANQSTNAGGGGAAAAAQATSAPFVFGSTTSKAPTLQGLTNPNTTTSDGIVAPAASWSKGGAAFTFGSSTTNTATPSTNNNETPKPVFGSFMSPAAPAVTTPTVGAAAGTSVFGKMGASSTSTVAGVTFGSVAAAGASAGASQQSTIFGSTAGTPTAPTQQTPNLFGSVTATPQTTFGAAPSFGSGSSNNATGFGVPASSATFGSFAATSSGTSGDGASAPKKSEPAFNFGGSSNTQLGSSGAFNFGAQASTAAKPAFNFSATSAPSFNFTGSSGDAAKPFQFGAAPAAPVFNFSGGAVEATPNAPFQFNAGAAPATSNIFAPTPAAPNAPGAMQARRKIRQPTRRLTPR